MPKFNAVSADDSKRIVDMYISGTRLMDIVQTTGFCYATVNRHIALSGVHRREQPQSKYKAQMPMMRQLRDSGKTAEEIADAIGGNACRVRVAFREAGHPFEARTKYMRQHIDRAVALHESGMNPRQIGEIVGRSGNAVRAWLKNHGSYRTIGPRIYPLNEGYFDEIDTEEKAYWLGMITSDGWLKEPHVIGLSLNASDRVHVERFRSSIGYEGPLYKHAMRGFVSYRVQVSSRKMVSSLCRYGLHQNKSLTVMPSVNMFDARLHRHYWRGVFDGDGCISCSHRDATWQLTLVGSKYVVGGLREFVLANGIVSKAKVRLGSGGRIHLITYGGKQLPLFVASLMYDDTTVSLQRKYDRYMAMKHAVEGDQPCLPH